MKSLGILPTSGEQREHEEREKPILGVILHPNISVFHHNRWCKWCAASFCNLDEDTEEEQELKCRSEAGSGPDKWLDQSYKRSTGRIRRWFSKTLSETDNFCWDAAQQMGPNGISQPGVLCQGGGDSATLLQFYTQTDIKCNIGTAEITQKTPEKPGQDRQVDIMKIGWLWKNVILSPLLTGDKSRSV